MHILYIHQHFAVPGGSTGTRSYEFARRWVKAGHQVTVISGHYDIGGLEYSKKPFDVEGITIVMTGGRYSNKQGFFKRIWSFFSFMLLSIMAGLRMEKPDVIYATSTPLTVGVPAVVLKLIRRVPFVFEVRDQWPEIPIELGIIKNLILKRFLLWLEKRIYLSSAAIVALSPGMADGVGQVVGNKKEVVVVPNSSDIDLFHPAVDGSAIRKEQGWDNKFVLLHFGAMGKANDLGFLIDVAERLKEYNDIHFVIIGDGATRKTLVDESKKRQLTNIDFLGSIAKDKLPEYVAACDISTVIFADFPILEHNSANKFFDSLSAGKPVLLNYSGWQREILEDNGAGFGCDLCNLDEFVEKVLYLHCHREEVLKMGIEARRIAVGKYDRQQLATEALDVIEKVKLSL